jgi:predicted glutamine amidotransferase
MCIIIHKPEGKRIPRNIIERAKVINPHGFGVTYLDSGKTRRTLDYTSVNRILNTNRPIVAHFRFATVGAVDINNVHPFSVDNRTVIYSNGTVDGYGSDTQSDVADIADNVLPKIQPNQ